MASSFRDPVLILKTAATVLILKVTAQVIYGYRNYLPPNFQSDFLFGRESYFYGPYQYAFWCHLIAGPASLVLGLLLISTAFRRQFPQWHRRLGRIQVAIILILLVPSGMWMACYPLSGPIAGFSLMTLAVLTGWTAAQGWRDAVQRRFAEHRIWMLRNYTLLCSAVVLRILGGASVLMRAPPDWYDIAIIWISWLLPVTILELILWKKRRRQSSRATTLRHQSSST